MKKPSYEKHRDSDWSGVYYGDELKVYFQLPQHKYSTGHWYSDFSFTKANAMADIMFFFIKKDLEQNKIPDRLRFYGKKKLEIRYSLKRIFYLWKFKKYFSLNKKNIIEFLTQPVYTGCTIQ